MLIHGDCRELAVDMPENSVHAVLCDPPYHLTAAKGSRKGFLGHEWDGGDIAFRPETWADIARPMRPGAYLAAFGGTRTFDQIAGAIRASGLEIRGAIAWLYADGSPKTEYDLKNVFEPITIARKPLGCATEKANFERYGTGRLGIDDCRIPWPDDNRPAPINKAGRQFYSGPRNDTWTPHEKGRWPPNVVVDDSIPIDPDMAKILPAFKFCRRPKGWERVYGTESVMHLFEPTKLFSFNKPAFRGGHVTMKPIELMRWLVRLFVPRGGTVFDPFLGSGTTAIAAILEGRRWIGTEKDDKYHALCEARIAAWTRLARSSTELLLDGSAPPVKELLKNRPPDQA